MRIIPGSIPRTLLATCLSTATLAVTGAVVLLAGHRLGLALMVASVVPLVTLVVLTIHADARANRVRALAYAAWSTQPEAVPVQVIASTVPAAAIEAGEVLEFDLGQVAS